MIPVLMIAALFWSGDFYSQPGVVGNSPDSASFSRSSAIAVTPDGTVWILDRERHRIFRHSDERKSVDAGGYGWSSSGFDEPYDLCAPNGIDIYVADYGNHRVQRLDRGLNVVSSFSLRDAVDPKAQGGYPRSVAIDRFGALYIVDGENDRVVKIADGSRFERSFGGIESGAGRLREPGRIRVSDDDVVFVQENSRIVAFDLFGNYIRTVGEGLFISLRFIAVDRETLYAVDSCSVFRITGKGTRVSRGFLRESASVSCADIVDLAVQNERLWVLGVNRLTQMRKNDLFAFPEDQQR